MARAIALLVLLLFALPARAETVVAARDLRVGTRLVADDLLLADAKTRAGFADPMVLVGLEMRATVYAGHPILASQVGAPILVARNQNVALIYLNGPVLIVTEGRALGQGTEGEFVKVLNATSRKTVTGMVLADGSVLVEGSVIPSN